MNNNGKQPRKVLLYGDFIPTGFGRICRAVGMHLNNLKYDMAGACLQWDGILPLQPTPMPFHVCALNGRDMGQGPAGLANVIANVVNAYRPDVLISVQDFPYHEALRAAPIDWSVMAHIAITPVDGEPIAEHWIDFVPQLDGFMTISEFGVQAFRKRGVKAELCPPGVDLGEFNRLDDPARAVLRDRMGIPRDAFVVDAATLLVEPPSHARHAIERCLQVLLVDAAHQCQILQRLARVRRVVRTGAGHLEQCALPRNRHM